MIKIRGYFYKKCCVLNIPSFLLVFKEKFRCNIREEITKNFLVIPTRRTRSFKYIHVSEEEFSLEYDVNEVELLMLGFPVAISSKPSFDLLSSSCLVFLFLDICCFDILVCCSFFRCASFPPSSFLLSCLLISEQLSKRLLSPIDDDIRYK